MPAGSTPHWRKARRTRRPDEFGASPSHRRTCIQCQFVQQTTRRNPAVNAGDHRHVLRPRRNTNWRTTRAALGRPPAPAHGGRNHPACLKLRRDLAQPPDSLIPRPGSVPVEHIRTLQQPLPAALVDVHREMLIDDLTPTAHTARVSRDLTPLRSHKQRRPQHRWQARRIQRANLNDHPPHHADTPSQAAPHEANAGGKGNRNVAGGWAGCPTPRIRYIR